MSNEREPVGGGAPGYDDPPEEELELRARDRPGKAAWLGPIATGVGVLSWLTPIGGVFVAVVAILCGVVSIATRRPYRIDWTAVLGICLGAGELFLELVLLAISASGL